MPNCFVVGPNIENPRLQTSHYRPLHKYVIPCYKESSLVPSLSTLIKHIKISTFDPFDLEYHLGDLYWEAPHVVKSH